MNVGLVGLALLMAAVTYPARAIPLLAPAFERLPPLALEYLRLVGPAVLGAIAASQVLLGTGADGRPAFHVGIDAVGVCRLRRPGCLAPKPLRGVARGGRPDRRVPGRRGRLSAAAGRDRHRPSIVR